jgi:hypothetical protein
MTAGITRNYKEIQKKIKQVNKDIDLLLKENYEMDKKINKALRRTK